MFERTSANKILARSASQLKSLISISIFFPLDLRR